MALKDLVADKSRLTEEEIENIIRGYVRYDTNLYEIVLTPAGVALNNEAKVLVLLVATAGWEYVVQEVQPVDTRPAALERMTGIPGGTLRPILKKLKDAHLIVNTNEGYAVRIANLDAIGRVVAGEKVIPKATAHNSRRISVETPDGSDENCEASSESRNGRKRRKAGVPIRSSLIRLVDADFFAEDRTLKEVVSRLHEMAIIARVTSLSGPIADLVREGKLIRRKTTEGGKEVWCYRNA